MMDLLTVLIVKKLNFKNPRWRTVAILKTVKSPYLRNRLTDFDDICHVEAEPVSSPYRPLKIQNFKIKKGGCQPYSNANRL